MHFSLFHKGTNISPAFSCILWHDRQYVSDIQHLQASFGNCVKYAQWCMHQNIKQQHPTNNILWSCLAFATGLSHSGAMEWYDHSAKQFGKLWKSETDICLWPRHCTCKECASNKDFQINIHDSFLCNCWKLEMPKYTSRSEWIN